MRDRTLTVVERDQYATTSAEIHTALLSVKQKLPWLSADRGDLYNVAKVKQLAALLYLHERLGPVFQLANTRRRCQPFLSPQLVTEIQTHCAETTHWLKIQQQSTEESDSSAR